MKRAIPSASLIARLLAVYLAVLLFGSPDAADQASAAALTPVSVQGALQASDTSDLLHEIAGRPGPRGKAASVGKKPKPSAAKGKTKVEPKARAKPKKSDIGVSKVRGNFKAAKKQGVRVSKPHTADLSSTARKNIKEALRAHRDIRSPNNIIMQRAKLDPGSRAALTKYRNGVIAQTAKMLAPKLATMTKNQFLRHMRKEVRSGRATELPKVKQPTHPSVKALRTKMRIWEYKDGTVVRYKPGGDPRRPYPVYSVEVKKVQQNGKFISDRVLKDRGIAFKLDSRAVPLPATPKHMPSTVFSGVYKDKVMEATHRGFLQK